MYNVCVSKKYRKGIPKLIENVLRRRLVREMNILKMN